MIPGLAGLILFSFVPMSGLYMAFVDYRASKGIFGSEFVGFNNFELIFADPLLFKMIRNTLIISGLKLVIGFPLPIILALLINALRVKWFKRTFQSVSYLPHFISWIIISSMMVILLDADNGLFNKIIAAFGGNPVSWYSDHSKWYVILLLTHIWKTMGWSSIIFLAGLTAIDTQLYEAAGIDGAGKMTQIRVITLPGIANTIAIVLILSVGKIFTDDFEQIYSLVGGNPALAETTEVISTLVFKYVNGGLASQFPRGTAMGLVQGVVSLILIVAANLGAKKLGNEGIF
jgi:putative aldouronate transport system permease protein